MTVSAVTEMWMRRNPGYSSPDGQTTQFRLRSAYQVIHDPGDTDDTILLDSNLPRVTDQLPGKPGVYCSDVGVTEPGIIMSVVEAQWVGDANPDSGSPLELPVTWAWTNTITNEPVDRDANGVALDNANGELKQGFTKELNDFTLTVNRNFDSINTYALSQYLDSVNSDPFGSPDSIWPAGTCHLRNFSAPLSGNAAQPYYAVTAVFDFRIPYKTIPQCAWWYRYRNDGRKVRLGARVTFSGGGASKQAIGYPLCNSAGEVYAVILRYGGRGYTSAPTVTISSDDSGASSATATATIASGQTNPAFQQVQSVTITNPGTGYRSRLVLATDAIQQLDGDIVCLKADGSLERDVSQALWIERQKYEHYLPYNALGLF